MTAFSPPAPRPADPTTQTVPSLVTLVEGQDPPGPGTTASEVWRDDAGRVCAVGYSDGGHHRMDVPGAGTFWFTDKPDGSVLVRASRDALGDVVVDTFRRTVLPMVVQVRGHEVLHASAVITPEGVVALAGRSGSGKSTLAYGLAFRGHRLWADDAVVFRPADGRVRAVPVPFGLRLLPSSLEHFRGRRPPGDVSGAGEGSAAPLAAVCLLQRVSDRDADATLTPVDSTDAFLSILRNAYCFEPKDQGRNRRMMESYLRLSRDVPVFRLRVPDDLARLEEVLDVVEAIVLEPTVRGSSVGRAVPAEAIPSSSQTGSR
jgi:hypothetical protein